MLKMKKTIIKGKEDKKGRSKTLMPPKRTVRAHITTWTTANTKMNICR